MTRAVNAVLIALAVFVVMAGSIFYFTVVQAEDDIEITSIESSWDVGRNSTTIVVVITFENNMDLDAELKEAQAEFIVDGETLGTNLSRSIGATLPGGEANETTLRIPVPPEAVSGWFRSHVENDEASTARLAGSAVFATPRGEDARVTFNETGQWETDLAGQVADASNCGSGDAGPCVDDAEAEWAIDDETAVLDATFTVSNPGEREIQIEGAEFALTLRGVPVAEGTAEGPVSIEAGGEEDLDVRLFFQHEAMTQWWVEHVDACESSPAGMSGTVRYGVIEPEPEPEPEDNETGNNSTDGNSTGNNSTEDDPTNQTEPENGTGNATEAPSNATRASGPRTWSEAVLGLAGSAEPSEPAAGLFLQPENEQQSQGNQTAEWEFDLGSFDSAFVCAGAE